MRNDARPADEGAALVEAALVLPILLLVVLALAEIALYLWTLGLANKAVQIGLRQAVVANAVAVGPGLDPDQSATYWDGLTPGARCASGGQRGVCPAFAVQCGTAGGCRCSGACNFTFAADRLTPILDVMRAMLPRLRADNLLVSYETNGTGYVGRPVPVPVDVTVSLIGLTYEPSLVGSFGSSLPLTASARMPSESLSSAR